MDKAIKASQLILSFCSLLIIIITAWVNISNRISILEIQQTSNEEFKKEVRTYFKELSEGQTQILIEAPYRNAAVFAGMLETLKDSTRLAVCSGLTLPQMQIQSLRVADWKRLHPTLDKHTPVVFAFGP